MTEGGSVFPVPELPPALVADLRRQNPWWTGDPAPVQPGPATASRRTDSPPAESGDSPDRGRARPPAGGQDHRATPDHRGSVGGRRPAEHDSSRAIRRTWVAARSRRPDPAHRGLVRAPRRGNALQPLGAHRTVGASLLRRGPDRRRLARPVEVPRGQRLGTRHDHRQLRPAHRTGARQPRGADQHDRDGRVLADRDRSSARTGNPGSVLARKRPERDRRQGVLDGSPRAWPAALQLPHRCLPALLGTRGLPDRAQAEGRRLGGSRRSPPGNRDSEGHPARPPERRRPTTGRHSDRGPPSTRLPLRRARARRIRARRAGHPLAERPSRRPAGDSLPELPGRHAPRPAGAAAGHPHEEEPGRPQAVPGRPRAARLPAPGTGPAGAGCPRQAP